MADSTGLLAYLIVEGCLPMAAGEQPRAAPPKDARILSEQERAHLKHRGPGLSVAYGDGALIADYGADAATFALKDAAPAAALASLEAALLGGPRDAQVISDGADPTTPGQMRRRYFVRLNDRRFADIEAFYPAQGEGVLTVRVIGKEAVGRTHAA